MARKLAAAGLSEPGASPGCHAPHGPSWASLGPESQPGPENLAGMCGVLGRPGPPRQEAAGKAGPRGLHRGSFQSRAKKTVIFLALLLLWCRMTGFDRTVRFSICVLQLAFIVLSKVGNGTHIMGCRPQIPSPVQQPHVPEARVLATVCPEGC